MTINVSLSRKLGGDKCWYCGCKLTPWNKTSDHFWPECLGGRLKVSCCRNCNSLKGTLTPVGFIDMLKLLKENGQYNAAKIDRMINATQTLWDRIDKQDLKLLKVKYLLNELIF